MNSFGKLFRISVWGESHGLAVGVLIDGCPAGLKLKPDDFTLDMDRRRSGQKGTTSRTEKDIPQIISGIFAGKTTGAPINISFYNEDANSKPYTDIQSTPRPGHADFTAKTKFDSFNDYRGGGHFSGRITVGLVVAGVIAKKIIPTFNFKASLIEAGGLSSIEQAVDAAAADKNSIGGIVECKVTNVPIGLGEPFFDSTESLLSHALFSIPGVKAVEFGAGFEGAKMYGSNFNDCIIDSTGKTKTNNAGGINGGITNGNELVFRVAFRPTASIGKVQNTFNFDKQKMTQLELSGRHDTCFALRTPVIVEAVTAIVLADLNLQKQAFSTR